MAFLYPWGNTQQLNLDWILQKIKELEAGTGGADLDEVANALISASYSRQPYDRSDIVFYDGKLYRANQAIPAPGEVWTPAHWDEILLGDTVSNLVQYVAALSNDQIANSSNVSGTHTSDALNNLKNAIDGITLDSDSVSNESLVPGDNVSDALDNLNDAISATQTDIAPILPEFKANMNLVAGVMRIYGGQLYKTTQAVQNGDDLIIGTNVKVTDVNTEFARGDARNITRYGNFQELADFSGTAQETIQLTENAQHYTMILMQVFNSNNDMVASCYMPVIYFHNLNVKLYGESNSQWGSFQLSNDYLYGTFNRTSTNTTHIKIIGFFNTVN